MKIDTYYKEPSAADLIIAGKILDELIKPLSDGAVLEQFLAGIWRRKR